jgi:hypothetical protein
MQRDPDGPGFGDRYPGKAARCPEPRALAHVPLHASAVLSLQRSAGNQAVLELLADRTLAKGSLPPLSKASPSLSVQRLALYMEDDQKEAVEILARKGEKSWGFSREERSGNYHGAGKLTEYGDDRTLTLWGHCGQEAFGRGMGPDALVEDLLARRFDRSGFTTLELIGCGPNVTFNKTVMSYAQTVKFLLDQKMDRSVTVKSFPMPAAGKVSTNVRFEPAGKFLYISCNEDQLATLDSQFKVAHRVYWPGHGKNAGQAQKAYEACVLRIEEMNSRVADDADKVKATTGDITGIRGYLKETHKVTTHKESAARAGSGLSELLLPDVVGGK